MKKNQSFKDFLKHQLNIHQTLNLQTYFTGKHMLLLIVNMEKIDNSIKTEVQQVFQIFISNKIPVIIMQQKAHIKIRNLLPCDPHKYCIEPY